MADPKPAPAKGEPAPVLGRAAESSDPRVHQLLAERIIAGSPGVEDEDAVRAIDARLADLGVSVA